jgi:hypothetical protein
MGGAPRRPVAQLLEVPIPTPLLMSAASSAGAGPRVVPGSVAALVRSFVSMMECIPWAAGLLSAALDPVALGGARVAPIVPAPARELVSPAHAALFMRTTRSVHHAPSGVFIDLEECVRGTQCVCFARIWITGDTAPRTASPHETSPGEAISLGAPGAAFMLPSELTTLLATGRRPATRRPCEMCIRALVHTHVAQCTVGGVAWPPRVHVAPYEHDTSEPDGYAPPVCHQEAARFGLVAPFVRFHPGLYRVRPVERRESSRRRDDARGAGFEISDAIAHRASFRGRGG